MTCSVKINSRIWHPPTGTDIVINQMVVTRVMCVAAPMIQMRTNHLLIQSPSDQQIISFTISIHHKVNISSPKEIALMTY